MSARILKYYVSGHKNITRNLNVNVKRSQTLHSDARHKFHTFCKSCLVCNLFTLELCCPLGMFSHWSSHLHTPTPQPRPKETAFGCKSKQLVQLFFGVISSSLGLSGDTKAWLIAVFELQKRRDSWPSGKERMPSSGVTQSACWAWLGSTTPSTTVCLQAPLSKPWILEVFVVSLVPS